MSGRVHSCLRSHWGKRKDKVRYRLQSFVSCQVSKGWEVFIPQLCRSFCSSVNRVTRNESRRRFPIFINESDCQPPKCPLRVNIYSFSHTATGWQILFQINRNGNQIFFFFHPDFWARAEVLAFFSCLKLVGWSCPHWKQLLCLGLGSEVSDQLFCAVVKPLVRDCDRFQDCARSTRWILSKQK